MDETEEERPESLPQQVWRLATAGYRHAKALPAWWGMVGWVAICLGSQIVNLGLIGFFAYGFASSSMPYYYLQYVPLPTGALAATIYPLCGLYAAMGVGPARWRITASVIAILLYEASAALNLNLIDGFGCFVWWLSWFLVGVFVRWKSRTVLSDRDTSEAATPLQLTVANLFVLTTIAAAITAGAAWVFNTYPIASEPTLTDGEDFTWTVLLTHVLSAPITVIGELPVIAGLFPVEPRQITLRRVVVYACLSFGISFGLSFAWVFVAYLQQFPSIAIWSPMGLHWLMTAITSSVCTVLSLVVAGLWLRWWGYRRRPLMQWNR